MRAWAIAASGRCAPRICRPRVRSVGNWWPGPPPCWTTLRADATSRSDDPTLHRFQSRMVAAGTGVNNDRSDASWHGRPGEHVIGLARPLPVAEGLVPGLDDHLSPCCGGCEHRRRQKRGREPHQNPMPLLPVAFHFMSPSVVRGRIPGYRDRAPRPLPEACQMLAGRPPRGRSHTEERLVRPRGQGRRSQGRSR